MRTLFDQNFTLGHLFAGTALDDRMIGNGTASRMFGFGGNDEMHARHDLGSILRMRGGNGDDTFIFGGDVIAVGGRGADEFVIADPAPSTNKALIRDFNVLEDTLAIDHSGSLSISATDMRITVVDANTVQLHEALIVGFSTRDLTEPGDDGDYVRVQFTNYTIDVADSSQGWQATVEQELYARADGGADDFIL